MKPIREGAAEIRFCEAMLGLALATGLGFSLGYPAGVLAAKPIPVPVPQTITQAFAQGVDHTVKLLLDRKLIRAPLFLDPGELKEKAELTIINVLEPTPTNGPHAFNCAVHVDARGWTSSVVSEMMFRLVDCGDLFPNCTCTTELR